MMETAELNTGLVLVDFMTTWCGPCKNMMKIVDGVEKKFSGKMKVCKVDCEEHPDMTDRFKVASVPTFVLLQNGKEVFKHVGTIEQQKLEDSVASFV